MGTIPTNSYGPYAGFAASSPSASKQGLPSEWQFLANSPMVGAPSFGELAGALKERQNRGISNDGFSVPTVGAPSPSFRAPNTSSGVNLPPGFGTVPTGQFGIPTMANAPKSDTRQTALKNMTSQTATVGLPDLSVLKALASLKEKAKASSAPPAAPPPTFNPMPMMMMWMMMKKKA